MKDGFAALNPVDSPSSHTEKSSRGPSRNRSWAKNVSKRKRITERGQEKMNLLINVSSTSKNQSLVFKVT
jgi:hypothetical protein